MLFRAQTHTRTAGGDGALGPKLDEGFLHPPQAAAAVLGVCVWLLCSCFRTAAPRGVCRRPSLSVGPSAPSRPAALVPTASGRRGSRPPPSPAAVVQCPPGGLSGIWRNRSCPPAAPDLDAGSAVAGHLCPCRRRPPTTRGSPAATRRC